MWRAVFLSVLQNVLTFWNGTGCPFPWQEAWKRNGPSNQLGWVGSRPRLSVSLASGQSLLRCFIQASFAVIDSPLASFKLKQHYGNCHPLIPPFSCFFWRGCEGTRLNLFLRLVPLGPRWRRNVSCGTSQTAWRSEWIGAQLLMQDVIVLWEITESVKSPGAWCLNELVLLNFKTLSLQISQTFFPLIASICVECWHLTFNDTFISYHISGVLTHAHTHTHTLAGYTTALRRARGWLWLRCVSPARSINVGLLPIF